MTDPVQPRKLSGSSNTIGLRNRSKLDDWLGKPGFSHYSEQESRWKMPGPHTTYTCHGTHVGHTRRINEDALFVNEAEGLWLVADGIGGHGNGDKASAAVVEHVESYCQRRSVEESLADITSRLRKAHQVCKNMAGAEMPSSTVAALVIFQSKAILIWAGDSRIYRLRNGELTLLTEDHNLAQERYKTGELSLEAAQRLKSANVLTRAVGVHQDLHLDADFAEVEAGDRFLVCTDGLYKELPLEQIQSMLGVAFSEHLLADLIDEALRRGGRDNITGIVIDVR
ncbi:MAG: serine/threonine-protein phosphatase [Luminiphilus sp.]|jgi:serine/threonine protein phosphatase PrpC|nr:serine/threonine-protein phosphatase [Luminiphilus sp.]